MFPTGGRVGGQQHPPACGDGQGHPQEWPAFLLPHRQWERGASFPRGPGRPALALSSSQEESEIPPSAQNTSRKAVKQASSSSLKCFSLSYSSLFFSIQAMWWEKILLTVHVSNLSCEIHIFIFLLDTLTNCRERNVRVC